MLITSASSLAQPAEAAASIFLARREDEDALNRSDRQRASSTNPWRPREEADLAIGMEPR